jgi:hypothetical protein
LKIDFSFSRGENMRQTSALSMNGLINPAKRCITVIEGSSALVSDILFQLCAGTACSGHDAIVVDGANSFNPYAVSRTAKFLGYEPRSVLSRIHVARAFTEYQMDAIMADMKEAVVRWNPALVALLYPSNLFSTADGKRLFGPMLVDLKNLTLSYGFVTAMTSFGGNWWGDRMLAGSADRRIRIYQTKTHVRVLDGENVFDCVAVPPGQTRFDDYITCGGETSGQNRSELQVTA